MKAATELGVPGIYNSLRQDWNEKAGGKGQGKGEGGGKAFQTRFTKKRVEELFPLEAMGLRAGHHARRGTVGTTATPVT